MNKYFLSLFLLFFINQFYSQNKSVNINFGVSSEGKFANGQYFSCDVRLSIAKSLYLSPTFTFSNSIPNYTNSILITSESTTLAYSTGKLKEKFNGRKFGSFDLLLLFNPLELFNNNSSKHELIIGTGYGIKFNSQIRAFYNVDGQNPELTLLDYKSGTSLDLYMFKFDYNYKITQNTYLGVTTSSNIVDGDAGVILSGFQFGVKF